MYFPSKGMKEPPYTCSLFLQNTRGHVEEHGEPGEWRPLVGPSRVLSGSPVASLSLVISYYSPFSLSKRKTFVLHLTSSPSRSPTHKGDASSVAFLSSARPRRLPSSRSPASTILPLLLFQIALSSCACRLRPSSSPPGLGGDAASDEAALTGAGPLAHPWRGRSGCTRPGKGTM